jgi:hypothetical protein
VALELKVLRSESLSVFTPYTSRKSIHPCQSLCVLRFRESTSVTLGALSDDLHTLYIGELGFTGDHLDLAGLGDEVTEHTGLLFERLQGCRQQ